MFHLHDIEQSVVRGDIEIYLGVELEGLSPSHIRQLSEQSGKLFIFAATVVRYVKPDDEPDIWYDRLETILSADWSLGSKAYNPIDTLYNTILSAALSRDELEPADVEAMKQVLYTVICAKEPMTIQTLTGMLGVSISKLVRVVDPLRSVLHVSQGNQLVSTLHASFSDYMLNQDRSKGLFCNASAHHHFLALRCFDVMKKSLRFNICNLESSYVLDVDVPNLAARVDNAVSSHLFYACSHWADHVCEPEAEGGLMALLDDFLSNGMLFWLEVLSLKKCIGVGATMLAKLQKWLQERNAPDAICRIVQDAYKFAILTGTCRSTPHIYVSVLALWNRDDPMWASYGTRVQGLVPPGDALHLEASSRLLATWNKGGCVWSIAVSLDGSRIVSDYGCRFIVWDACTGNQILSPTTRQTMPVCCVAISPNGRSIASGSEDGTIYIWDAETADIIAGPLKGHTNWVNSVVFSPDSARIASSSDDHTIRIWDTQSGHMLLGPLEGHTDWVNSVAFSPDGGRVASGSYDRTIRVWGTQTGHVLMSLFGRHMAGVTSVAFSSDGARIASGSLDSTICIWDAQIGGMLAGPFREQSRVLSVAFSLDDSRIVSGSLDGTISVWCAHSGSVLASFDAATDAISSVVFSPDGNRLISSSEDRTIRIWDMNTSNLRANQQGSDSYVRSYVFSPDSRCIALKFSSGVVHVWDMDTGSLFGTLFVPDAPGCHIALSSKGTHLALGLDGNIDIWDVKNANKLLGPLKGHTSHVRSLAFSPDGKRLASGSDRGTIHVWDVQTGSILSGPLKGHAGSVDSVAFSPDGARIASGSGDCIVRIWDGQSGDMIFGRRRAYSRSVSSVRFSPDGRLVVSGSRDSIRVWDTQTGNVLANQSARDNLESFSPDLSRIVSGSWDGAIQIRDAQTEQTLVGPFEAHTGDVDFVAFSPDGSRVVSRSKNGHIFIWELRKSDYDVNNAAGAWTIQKDGWIVGRNSARLLWLPPALRTLSRGKPIVAHSRGPFGVDTDWARWAACFSET
ncbi:hypothetical protein FS749_002637 [Ceratobasidium sp. UAMH 11750]|nr:hypothetical protein FS749_002637 [Ceratobasidium sp. UAMH 11750]